jgi:hypothetical protein
MPAARGKCLKFAGIDEFRRCSLPDGRPTFRRDVTTWTPAHQLPTATVPTLLEHVSPADVTHAATRLGDHMSLR